MTEQASPYRPEFEAALRAFARASEAMKRKDVQPPVLVGGAAAELYSGSAINTGDFDVVTAWQDEFEATLRDLGFTRPGGPGHTPLGWIHPDLGFGFEVVGSTLLDGKAERQRIRIIEFGADGAAQVIAVEDMIADRMGQYASGSAPEMLGQARKLYSLHPDADLTYLDRRIREETLGDYGIEALERGGEL